MKKTVIFFLTASLFMACNNEKKENSSVTVSDDKKSDQTLVTDQTASAAKTGSGTATGTGVSRFDVTMTAEQNAAIPEVSGGLPVLPGTSWAVISIYEKGETPKTQFRPSNFLFCKNGKWEHQTGTLFLGGNYTVSETVLTTDDGPGTKSSEWKLSWDGSVKEMEMEQGNLIFVLRYQGKTQC